jgi:tetratricopeptide (TPR) repeat protein
VALSARSQAAAAAREAGARGDWSQAFELFMRLDADGSLDPSNLSMLAEVGYAAGHLDVAITAWERLYAACVEADDRISAGGAAARVAMHLLFDTALMAPVRGWLRRSERLLHDQPDSPAHAWHAVVQTYERLLSGDRASARHWAERAVALGSQFDPAAAAIGRVAVARLLILDGEVDAGLASLDEVGVAATAGELDPLSTGVVYCELVCALQGVAQYDIAEEWTEAMERWCETNAIGSLHGRCRVHRAEILRLRGRCDEAEAEAAAACEELRPYLRRELGWPLTELGQIRLRRGDIAGAERALLDAQHVGWDPEPGLAGMYLAEGDVLKAVEGIRDALDRPVLTPSKERPPNNSLQRAPLLAAQVDIEIAAGELDRARAAADELEGIADRFKSSALAAHAQLARGRVRLAEGRTSDAVEHLSEAIRAWRDIGAPFELAVARRGLGEAYLASGRERQAEVEFDAARLLFEQIALGSGHQADTLAGRQQTANGECRFAREGDYWTIDFGGRTVRVHDLKGIRYLRRLLADPGREFHVLDLVNSERGTAAEPDRSSRGFPPGTAADGGLGLLDDQARTAYRRRLVEIEDDIEEARTMGDIERVAQAEAEREFLIRELSRAFGLGGRHRKSGTASERARAAVTRAVRTAIDRIAEYHPPLGSHLVHAVKTGTYCSYQPDPSAPIDWKL